MTPRTRRSALALLAGAATGLAGCAADRGGRSPGRTDPTSASTPTDRGPSSTTTTPTPDRRLVLTRVERSDVSRATVYPEPLRSWLREAATTGRTVRGRAPAAVYAPQPFLRTVDRVRLRSPDGAVDGVYDVVAEGGPYYEWRVGTAEVTDVPEDAAVTPVGDLPAERRALVERALQQGGTLVGPETELGTWVRHDFLGGYVSRDGTVYRGRKIQQTDAAFFSTTVWLVLSLSPVGGTGTPTRATGTATATPGSPVTLSLAPVPDAVRDAIDRLVGVDHSPREQWTTDDLGPQPSAVTRWAGRTGAVLFHTGPVTVRVEAAIRR